MFECRFRERCQFYSGLSSKLGLAVLFVTHYCHGPGYPRCARYLGYAEMKEVPADLYPNQTWRMKPLVRKKAETLVTA